MIKEEWKPITYINDIYYVSNLGRVKCTKKWNIRDLKHDNKECLVKINNYNRYPSVRLVDRTGKRKRYSLHRLVAKAFLPNPNNYPVINHKDENTHNNRVDNLEWCTQKYNINYGTRTQKAKEKQARKVYQFDLSGNLIKEWLCGNDAIRFYNNYHINACLNGKRKTASNFIWKYEM